MRAESGWQDVRFSTPVAVTAGTTYVATLPERIAGMAAPGARIKTFPLPFDVAEHHEILLWHKRHEPDPAHAWLRELIIDLARTM